jgi:starch synthase
MPAVEELLQLEPTAQIVILGNGPTELNLALKAMTEKADLRGRLCFLQGFSVDLASRVYAAGDFFVMPSRYEPCGLTDFIAQLFGNLPIVHHVGGLVKVVDGVTGIAYHENDPSGLVRAMERAMEVYRDDQLKRHMQLQAVQRIKEQHTWSRVKERYLDLYRRAREEQVCQE